MPIPMCSIRQSAPSLLSHRTSYTFPTTVSIMSAPHAPPSADSASARLMHRHQELMRLYSASTRRSTSVGSDTSSITSRNDHTISQNDLAVLKQKFQFIRDEEADAEQGDTDWQVRMSVRYYRKLFREYALADLSRYQEGKIGLRWRTEREVIAGKGQFTCGNKRCDARDGLRSYELLFAYTEHGERKRCLVKVRACSSCAEKLFYKRLMEARKRNARKTDKRARKRRLEETKHQAKRQRRSASSSDSASNSGDEAGSGVEASSDLDGRTAEDIHELCAKINDQEKAAYAEGAAARRRSSDERSDDLAELLP